MPQIEQKISPYLWFDSQAEEAADYYCNIFPNAAKGRVTRYSPSFPGRGGKAMTVSFQLFGLQFTALNGLSETGDPLYRFTPAISFVISCDNQNEVDAFWEGLSAGGKEQQCGWVTDKFGVTWQIVPKALMQMLGDPDPAKAQRVTQAMMKMKRIDIAALERARDAQ
jgi:predicted 3-demethylubiquinone-9 3-methyltransferase (glyoxalase superfamily)